MTEIKLRIKTPSVPNFVKIEGIAPGKKEDGWVEVPGIPVGDLTDAQLESLAVDWKKALFENAERQRKEK